MQSSFALRLVLLALPLSLPTFASPISLRTESSGTPTPATDVLNKYSFPAQLAQEAYCAPAVNTQVGDATILWTEGDGTDVPLVYVAHSPSRGIVVAHQGTNSSSLASIGNDANFIKEPADSRLSFLGDGVEIESGFQGAWLDTADDVLQQVQSALSAYPGSGILVVGHSLGAAISLLDAVYIQHSTGVSVTAIGFGLPRTGNQQFADAIDANLAEYRHVVNYDDIVPHLPPQDFGYQHPSGEVWINPANSSTAFDCPGQENENCADSIGAFDYSSEDHLGVYFNVHISGRGGNCPAVIMS